MTLHRIESLDTSRTAEEIELDRECSAADGLGAILPRGTTTAFAKPGEDTAQAALEVIANARAIGQEVDSALVIVRHPGGQVVFRLHRVPFDLGPSSRVQLEGELVVGGAIDKLN